MEAGGPKQILYQLEATMATQEESHLGMDNIHIRVGEDRGLNPPQSLHKKKVIEPEESIENNADTIQDFSLQQRGLKLQNFGGHISHGNAQSHTTKQCGLQKQVTAQREVYRQDSGEIIDKQRAQSRLLPAEAGPTGDALTPVDPGKVRQLGVVKKSPQKRVRVEHEVGEPPQPLHFQEPSINGTERFPPARPLRKQHTDKKDEAWKLVTTINKASKEPVSRSPEAGQRQLIVFDESLQAEDLDIPESSKVYLGSGQFGQVSCLQDKTGRKIVEKRLQRSGKPRPLIHPNELIVPLDFANSGVIPKLLAFSWDGQYARIFQEHVGPSLAAFVKDEAFINHPNQADLIQQITLGVFKALRVLHRHHIKHRDVKPGNICYDSVTGQVRLIDLGSSRTLQDESKDVSQEDKGYLGSTPEYLSVIVNRCLVTRRYKALTEKDDVWGAAMVALFLIKQAHPMILHFMGCNEYPDLKPAELEKARMVVLSQVARLQEPLPNFFLSHPCMPVMEMLLRGCLVFDENKRWTAEEAVYILQGQQLKQEGPRPKMRKLDNEAIMKLAEGCQKVSTADKGACETHYHLTEDLGKNPKNPQLVNLVKKKPAFAPGDQWTPPALAAAAHVGTAFPVAPTPSGPRAKVVPASHWHVEDSAADEKGRALMDALCTKSFPSTDISLKAAHTRPAATGMASPRQPAFHITGNVRPAASVFAIRYTNVQSTRAPITVMAPVCREAPVLGMWGQHNPHLQQLQQRTRQPDEPAGNIPNFLK